MSLSLQRRWSRSDVRPWGWELPVAVAACWVVVAAVVLPAGQAAASGVFGGGLVWPHGGLLPSIGGLLHGHAGRGLRAGDVARLAPAPAVYALIGLGEVALLAVTGWAACWWWRCLGPGAVQGMAERAEAERVLGLSNLRRRRRVIRPDLFGAEVGGRG